MLRSRNLVLVALATCLAGASVHSASAQQGPRVMLGGDPRVPQPVQQRLVQLFSAFGPVMPTGTPPQPGDIAVIAEMLTAMDGTPAVRLTYYDAVSGQALFGDELPIPGGMLTPQYDSYIQGRAQTALSSVARGPAPGGMRPAPGGMGPAPGGTMPGGPAPAAEPEPTAPPLSPEEAGRLVAGYLALGFGPGMHQGTLPTDTGTHNLPLAMFPAYGIQAEVNELTHTGGVKPGVRLSYRSSIGYSIAETPPSGQKVSSPARNHELMLDAVANINFGDSLRAVSLPLSLGWAWNNTRTDVSITWPRYTLSGAHLRAMLRIPFGGGDVVLTLGPDVEYIVQTSNSLQQLGIKPSGLAFGGEAQLFVQLTKRFALHALLREAHASVSSARVSTPLKDVQRFITLGAAWTF